MKHRDEITGLRALAVVPVVFYHAGVETISGGFVGVDIFFVISGYLIAYLIMEELERGKFSVVSFYERRARRILPALFFVMLISTMFAWFWLLPSQLKEYFQSLAAVTLFLSNVFFYFKSGYFASEVEEKPMIHTWSLAVEEQFYILFPLILLGIWKFRLKLIPTLFFSIIGASYIFAEYLSRTNADLSFYLMPTRAWELLLGASCAYYLFQKRTLHSNSVLASIGCLLILASLFFIDKTHPYPSFYTIPPVIGTCLIILYGQGTAIGQILSTRIALFVGLISYSAYLWHQPLLAFARIKFLGAPPDILMLLLALASFGFAWLSFKFVETPFRDRVTGQYKISQKTIFLFASVGSLIFLAAGAIGHIKSGFPDRFSIPEEVGNTIARSTNAYECFDLPYPHREAKWGCDIGDTKENTNYDFVVWGDSHLLVTYNAFVKAAEKENKKGFYAGIRQCTPLLGIHALRFDQDERNCHLLNKRVYEFVKTNKIPKIILVSRWSYYSVGGYDGDDISYIGVTPNSKKTLADSRHAYLLGLEKTVSAYAEIGTSIIFMEQVPQQKIHPEEAYYLAYRGESPDDVLNSVSVDLDEHLNMQDFVKSNFELVAKTGSNIHLMPTTDLFCESKCLIGDANTSLYFDEDHLSIEGSKLLTPRIREFIRE